MANPKLDRNGAFVVKGRKFYSPHEEAADSLDEAVENAWWARSQNMWAPRTVEDRDGKIILDEDALDAALLDRSIRAYKEDGF